METTMPKHEGERVMPSMRMPSAEARVPTDRGGRYLEQLCSHLGSLPHLRHLRHLPKAATAAVSAHGAGGMPRVESVERSESRAVIRFADGTWDLTAHDDALVLRVEAEDAAALERLKGAIAARIAQIGRRDGLRVNWSSDDAIDGTSATND
jgi:hypothetical protein